MAVRKSEAETITLKEIKIDHFPLRIVGDSPLIIHAWDEKAVRQMLEKQMKKTATEKGAKNPFADFVNSLYWLCGKPEEMSEEAFEEAVGKGAKFGFPSIGLKEAAACAGYRAKMTKDKVSTYAAFHIDEEFLVIEGVPTMRQDMVRLQTGVSDVRFRGEFREWSASFIVKYNTAVISPEIITNLINLAGFSVGLGEWRPDKGGRYGMFHVATNG
jgi:hypothetical protein